MRRIFNKTLASKILIQLAIILFCILKATAQPQSESFVQKLDDRVMMNIQKTRTPEKTDFMLFMSNTYRYGDIGIPAAMLVGGIVGHNEALRQNSLDVAGSTAISYAAIALIKDLNKAAKALCAKHQYRSGLRASSYSFPSGHRQSTFAAATALSIAYPKWYIIAPSFLWAGTVSYSRMYLGMHYPSDVGAGLILSEGSAASLTFLKK